MRAVTLIFTMSLFSSCFKDIPVKNVIYRNDFENGDTSKIIVYNMNGPMDSLKIVDYNGSMVFGRFNNNYITFNFIDLPQHNAVKIEFDLYIHDQWDGDRVAAGQLYPDIWQMSVDNFPVYTTSFSNGSSTSLSRKLYFGNYCQKSPKK